MTILSKKSAEDYKKQNYSERMARTGRPVSPHVTIYAFPIMALSSITNRITGIALSGIAGGMGLMELTCGSGSVLSLMQDIGTMSTLAPLTKITLGFSFTYHYLGGLRHVYYDKLPDKLTNVNAEQTSYALYATSALISGGLLLL
eukprot:CAMPEP_0194364100 /NCGR_PEP_ID=MMETSP0174-20130528/11997_1 /TAXON_ID=216777 /ORGANISM="Proboscia alata, Strain PI-D3" /LENGTH=144 /DNA_ID=CAMNT_0039137937 /DNA_START=134 /DNA_END=568 /DNA_ORIENTATION=-